jgi:hypothetical protein
MLTGVVVSNLLIPTGPGESLTRSYDVPNYFPGPIIRKRARLRRHGRA